MHNSKNTNVQHVPLQEGLLRLCLVRGRAALCQQGCSEPSATHHWRKAFLAALKGAAWSQTWFMSRSADRVLQLPPRPGIEAKSEWNGPLKSWSSTDTGWWSPQKLRLVRARGALLSPGRIRAQCESSGEKMFKQTGMKEEYRRRTEADQPS